jgi:hypothetical protein
MPFNSAATTASAQVVTGTSGPINLMGLTVRETAGSTARVEVRDGTTDSGDLVIGRTLVSGESFTDWFGPMGIRCTTGSLRIVRPSGTTEVEVYRS